jgi:hypothetical protein
MTGHRHYTEVIMPLQSPVIDCRVPRVMKSEFLDSGFPASRFKYLPNRFYREAVSGEYPLTCPQKLIHRQGNEQKALYAGADHWEAAGSRGGLGPGWDHGPSLSYLGIAEQTGHRWRGEFGGLKLEQATRLKAPEHGKAFRRLTIIDECTRECLAIG